MLLRSLLEQLARPNPEVLRQCSEYSEADTSAFPSFKIADGSLTNPSLGCQSLLRQSEFLAQCAKAQFSLMHESKYAVTYIDFNTVRRILIKDCVTTKSDSSASCVVILPCDCAQTVAACYVDSLGEKTLSGTHTVIQVAGPATPKPRAVVLLSGGLDSSTVLSVAISEGFEIHALSFRYGQRHVAELESAKRVAALASVNQHTIVDIDLRAFGASALTAPIAVPKDRDEEEMGRGIPVTYVPARNTIFLSFALALAEVSGADTIFLGVSAVDYSGYPDCRPEYIKAFEAMANLATARAVEGKGRVAIRAPLQHLGKADTIKLGHALGVDYSVTTSCYDPDSDGRACGRCDSCRLRAKGFAQAGLPDPTQYAEVLTA